MGWTMKTIFHALLFMLFVFSTEADEGIQVKPSSYEIDIVTNKDHFEKSDTKDLKFDGTVTIDFVPAEALDPPKDFSIVLNTNPKMSDPKLTMKGWETTDTDTTDSSHDVTCTSKHEKDKFYVNCTKDQAKYKRFKLTLKYKNPFGEDMTGFYRSSYIDSTGKTRWLLTTHFEPIFARNAFPCFDRPDLKAKFKVSITVPKSVPSYGVLSNTELSGDVEVETDLVKYTFKESDVPMSTYLVAFTASDLKPTKALEFTSKYSKEQASVKKKLHTFGRQEAIDRNDGDFAQKVAREAVEKLTAYLGEGYALQKIDQLGIPDFSAGAMENFGHISFREKSLFYNKNSSSEMTKQSNLLTIVHELVHQWFGNLVTLESWNYIWLNEAFATYLEYVIASQLRDADFNTEKWSLMEQLVINEIQSRAFQTDGLNSSKALSHNITDESLIFASFNDIAYSKGAAVLRMWDLSLGESKFQAALKEYISTRKEKTANPDQLYEVFKNDLKEEMFYSWTTQAGYPVVEIEKINDTLKLSQTRFFWEKINTDAKWYIPITYTTSEEKKFETVPKPENLLKDDKLELKNVKGKWFIINNQQAGYYRVNYQKENWNALTSALTETSFGGIPELNRAQLIDDVYSLARSLQKNYVHYSTALNLTKYLTNETSYIPLKTALSSFDFLLTKLHSESFSGKFKEYVLKIVQPHFVNLTIKVDDHLDRLKKVEITRWACALDFEPCVSQSKELFNKTEYAKHPDIQEIVLCTAVRTVNSAWDNIFNKYKEEKDSALKVMYLTALGCTGDSKKAEEFLDKTLKADSGIRQQDLIFVLSAVYNGNVKNLETAFTFVQKNFKQIATKYGGINPLGRAIVGIAKKINTKEQYDRLVKLVEEVKKSTEGKGSEESLDSALQIANSNLNWNKERRGQLGEYFSGSGSFAASLSLVLLCLLSVFRF